MSALRTFTALRLWVLAWFMASCGVAIAAPWVNPQGLQTICSGAGTLKLVTTTNDGTPELAPTGMDCPLCAAPGAPPPAPALGLPAPAQLAHALLPIPAARIAAATAAPLPARGPPSLRA